MAHNDGGAPKSHAGRLSKVSNFHETLLAQRLSPAQVPNYHLCGWSSAKSQLARFSALVSAVNFQGGSVADFGCGTGDLFGFLSVQGKEFTYLGLDMNERMLDIARASYAAEFRLIEPDTIDIDIPRVDYVFASGVFQFSDDSDPLYYRRLLGRLFAQCRVALGVNFLSASRAESEKVSGELYLHPSEVAIMASDLSGQWLVDHSYHPGHGDMTLGITVSVDKQLWRRPRVE